MEIIISPELVQVIPTTLEECFAEGQGTFDVADLFPTGCQLAGHRLEGVQTVEHIRTVL